MQAIRSLVIGLFVGFLRAISIRNYRTRVKQYLTRYHDKRALRGLHAANGHVNERLRQLGYRKKDTRWNLLYSLVSRRRSADFIPESLYYFQIEPRLNALPMRLAYSDKNMYDRWYAGVSGVKLPVTVLRNINGFLYDQKYELIGMQAAEGLLDDGKYIIKPSLDSGGGKNVHILEAARERANARTAVRSTLWGADRVGRLEDIARCYGKDYVVQQYIRQHKYFARLCPTSVNTMRVMTYRSVGDDRVHVIQRIMKIGLKGRVTDNEWTGSVTIGVSETGTLNRYAVNKFGVRHTEFNGLDIAGLPDNPFVSTVDRAARAIAGQVYYSRLVGMDFAVDEDGAAVFIEMNHSYNGINFFQYNNGPLFQGYTDEILEYCARQRRDHYVYY